MKYSVNIKCLYCNDFKVRCRGKGKACGRFPGMPDSEKTEREKYKMSEVKQHE